MRSSIRLPLEQRPKRRWVVFLAACVVGFGLLIPLAVSSILDEADDPVTTALVIGFLAVPLLGLVVIPGAWYLARVARGVPDVRMDWQGITWGADRTRDPFVPWSAIERIEVQPFQSQYMRDDVIIVRPAATSVRRPRAWSARVVLELNRRMYGSPFVISTATGRLPTDEILGTLVARVGPQRVVDRRMTRGQ